MRICGGEDDDIEARDYEEPWRCEKVGATVVWRSGYGEDSEM